MRILVTGVAGFIGFHVAQALLARGEAVLGVDNLNDYYDPALKHARLEQLTGQAGFSFQKVELADRDAVDALLAPTSGVTHIIHLAAQAGVRYSLQNPHAYISANIVAQINLLEAVRRLPGLVHFVYASSSSVYGHAEKAPFAVTDRTDRPLSLYAATKKADELFHYTYAHLYRIPATGLRFFTVYGPWGRPDMAAFLFTKAILAGEPIRLFNGGDMRRDFTYIDDIVAGVLATLDRPPADTGEAPPHRVYNLGNNHPEKLTDFVAILEEALGRKAVLDLQPMQPGDVYETAADITESRRDLGFSPTTPLSVGLPKFIAWYRDFYRV
jgi:UDP-glucuronate 4-epimerase